MTHTSAAFDAALQVTQQAVTVLAEWADPELAGNCPHSTEKDAVTQAKKMLSWHDGNLKPLKLLFDRVKLAQGQNRVHYWPASAIADKDPTIPYPQTEQPSDFSDLKKQIQQAVNSLHGDDWKNLSLLTLILEKFGSYLSFGESDVALVDMARSTAAVAAAIAHDPNATHLSLVAGDLSGIQKFIYTISSDGALKSLRARSFYLELVTEEVVQQLLAALELPRINVIYAGGGNLYLLATATNQTKEAVKQVRQQFNQWLRHEFQGKVFLALDCLNFPIEDIATEKFAVHWSDVTGQLAGHKSRKFADQITDFMEPRDSHEPCRVCHRDDVETLKQLNPNEPDSVLACGTCRRMFHLGGELLRVEAIVRSRRESVEGAKHTIPFKLPTAEVYYHLFSSWKQIVPESDTVLLVNDWTVEHYNFRHFRHAVPLLLGNYAQESKEEPGSIMRAGEMAEAAKGINRVGYLRMDVDRLGQIFAKGLDDQQTLPTLPRLAGLSRQISYFFKVYLNSLAENRQNNLPNGNIKCLTQYPRPNLLFIYAAGDDLFVSGAWNEVVEFAFDVYQCFRAYTGRNPDITLSGGISINDVKFPLYQAADESGEAEEAAKGNGKDSLGLFSEVFKWDEWLGSDDISVIDPWRVIYLHPDAMPSLWGVLPFVKLLNAANLDVSYARSFVRNLLATAQMQNMMIKERQRKIDEIKKSQPSQDEADVRVKKIKHEQQIKHEQRDIRYYLHLPKVAYALARLPNKVLEDTEFRTSLKSPYNAPYFRAIATWIELLNRS